MARRWWTLGVVCTGVFMLLLDITIVNVALPDIAVAFKATISGLQWVIDAYSLALASLLLTAGIMADRAGRRLLFFIGIGIFTMGSLLCGTSSGIVFLSISRAFQGIGGAIMFATSLAMLSESFKGRERGIAFGVFGAMTGIAIAVGPVIGGALVSGLGWRWIFFVNIPVGIIVFVATLLRVDESRDPNPKRLDLLGFITFSTGLAALIFGLIRSNTAGWGSLTVIGSLVGAAVLLAAFVAAEGLSRDPMFDLRLLRVPTFDGGLIAAFGISASIFSALTYLVLFLQDVVGLSALSTGVRFLPLSLSIFVAAGVAGRLTSDLPKRFLISPGFVLIGVGLLLMRGLTPTSGWTHLLPGMIVSGVGGGLVNVPLVATAVGVVPPSHAGMASGINSTFRQVGIATGIAVLGAIFIARIRSTVISQLAGTVLAAQSHDIAVAAASGRIGLTLSSLPQVDRPLVAAATRAGFVDGLNLILLIAALLTFLAAVTSFFLIREKDFVADQGRSARALKSAGPSS
ncbi:MAG: MFS transporter [Actinobacteria bacterium]|nr:MFS transporter [Actinomycetota bacterium]